MLFYTHMKGEEEDQIVTSLKGINIVIQSMDLNWILDILKGKIRVRNNYKWNEIPNFNYLEAIRGINGNQTRMRRKHLTRIFYHLK